MPISEHVFSKHTLVIHTVFSFLLTISVTKSGLQILIKTPNSRIGFSNISLQIHSGDISNIREGETAFLTVFVFKTRILALSIFFPLSHFRLNAISTILPLPPPPFLSLIGYVLA